MEKKICPMSLNAPADTEAQFCGREHCAWFFAHENACAVAALAGILHDVKLTLEDEDCTCTVDKQR